AAPARAHGKLLARRPADPRKAAFCRPPRRCHRRLGTTRTAHQQQRGNPRGGHAHDLLRGSLGPGSRARAASGADGGGGGSRRGAQGLEPRCAGDPGPRDPDLRSARLRALGSESALCLRRWALGEGLLLQQGSRGPRGGAGVMILFPAIDLKDGQAVRLLRGDMAQVTVFNPDPADQARRFAAAGFEWLHLVDLNGAFAGKPVNAAAVEAILQAVEIPVQLGGGIRDLATIERWLELGVARVILGTVAVKDPQLVQEACRAFPGRVVIGVDARDGMVAVEGWAETSEIEALELAKRFEGAGAAAIVHTDVERDGAMQGPNLAASVAL